MAIRAVPLSGVPSGMTRLLPKGGASQDALFLLSNGFVNASRRAQSRDGMWLETDTLEGTIGLCVFRDKFVVFAHQVVPMTDPDYTCEVLSHPDDPTQALVEVHFAEPFLGYLYVVAEFADGAVFHYWLESAPAWQALTAYMPNGLASPTTPNGLVYRAGRLDSAAAIWAPNVERTLADVIEPTTFNGFRYVAIETVGDPPRSGATEPTWPLVDGGLVTEEADVPLGGVGEDGGGQNPAPPPGTPPRYGGGGSRGPGTETELQ